jgi:hypothetical protein
MAALAEGMMLRLFTFQIAKRVRIADADTIEFSRRRGNLGGIAVVTLGRDLLAPHNRVPGMVGPLNAGHASQDQNPSVHLRSQDLVRVGWCGNIYRRRPAVPAYG